MSHKVTKDQAGYEPQGHKDSHCGPTSAFGDKSASDPGTCKHFVKGKSLSGGGCRLVLGEVARKGWCKLFSKTPR